MGRKRRVENADPDLDDAGGTGAKDDASKRRKRDAQLQRQVDEYTVSVCPHPSVKGLHKSICGKKHSERIGVRRSSRLTRRKKRSARRARQRNRLGSGITRGTCPSAGGLWTIRIDAGSFKIPRAYRTGLDRARVEAFCDRRKPTPQNPQCCRLDLFMLSRRRLLL